MRPKRLDAKSGCAVEVTLSVIGGLWKPLILFHLFSGKKRFMELCRTIPNATQRMLTLQLRELEADGVILRHVHAQIPPKVEYEISPFGQSLGPILLALRDWGEDFTASSRSTEVELIEKAGRSKTADPSPLCEAKVAAA
ncbi:winged helix-turn-helix transcriptional regulator [Rhizobium leguminosarum]|uniref:HxlR family transcriptional regulator n=2 Tax=Rhizobium leguminosarum TaxID=384 RepID=A0A154IPD3_RHILE|nr:helix-turn-helix domain-containing protein [Rhizobium leguminosarum]KZB01850.1 HxlR family transcriptional regulator [Rhizobium leguminosarum]